MPVLTVAGIEHVLDRDNHVNEAVILGPRGDVVHRHRKLTRYPDGNDIEGTQTGDVVTVLESPIGNLTPLICLDLFNDAVEPVVTASHANVLLVPSLSPTTSAHATAAAEFLASNLAATLVCNRWIITPDEGRGGTFCMLPGKRPGFGAVKSLETFKIAVGGDEDYLLAAVT